MATTVHSRARTQPAQQHNNNDDDDSPLLALYRKPTLLGYVRSGLINLVLPFLNGVFLGFGEIFAHEVAFLLGWRGANIRPNHRMIGPGVEMVGDPGRTGTRTEARRRQEFELEELTALE